MQVSRQVERLISAETGKPVVFGDELVLGGERVTFLDYLENLDWDDDAPEGDVRVQLGTGESRKVSPLSVGCHVERHG